MVYSLYNLFRYFYSNLIRTPTFVSSKVTLVSACYEADFPREFTVKNAKEDTCSRGEMLWGGAPGDRRGPGWSPPADTCPSHWLALKLCVSGNLVFRTPLLALILSFLIPEVTLVLTCQLSSWDVLFERLGSRALAGKTARDKLSYFCFGVESSFFQKGATVFQKLILCVFETSVF